MMDSNYLLRRVSKEDYENGHVKLYEQLTKINPANISKIAYENFINKLNDNHMIFVICDTKTNLIIGTATILVDDKLIHDMGRVGHIEDIVLDHEYRGKGLGQMLLKHLIEYARNMNCYKVILSTGERTVEFYKRCGFTQKGLQMVQYFDQ